MIQILKHNKSLLFKKLSLCKLNMIYYKGIIKNVLNNRGNYFELEKCKIQNGRCVSSFNT